MLDVAFFAFIFAMFLQTLFSIYASLYVWESPERIEATESPKDFLPPEVSFTVLLPARHEEAVIGDTLASIAGANYPRNLIQVIVVCDSNDSGTILAARTAIKLKSIVNAQVEIYGKPPINKPHGLNAGLTQATNEVTVIFDAEDDVHPDIFNIANTLYLTTGADVIQAGVQLMNYDSRWFSVHNVLEYFFWFKSRMHFNAKVGVVPLGGNTVFFRTAQIRALGGWDEGCLTEDAEIGIRMTAHGAKFIATYDPKHVTREETPMTIEQFLKQRTRWNQGFLQVAALGHWREYDTLVKRIFCVYTLTFPIIQALLSVITPIVLLFGFEEKVPMLLGLFSLLPIILLLAQILISMVALREFLSEQKLKQKLLIYPWMALTFIPYQLLLSISAIRACYRYITSQTNWEKTAHHGTHRQSEEITPQASSEALV